MKFLLPGQRKLVSEGTHVALVTQVIDLGVQVNPFVTDSEADKGKSKTHPRVSITFEITDENLDDGRPLVISKEFTVALTERSHLLNLIERLLHRPLQSDEIKTEEDGVTLLKSLLGRGVQVEVVHKPTSKGRLAANIKGFLAVPKSMTLPKPVNPLVFFSLSDPDAEKVKATLPQFIQDKINTAVDQNDAFGGAELPFEPDTTL